MTGTQWSATIAQEDVGSDEVQQALQQYPDSKLVQLIKQYPPVGATLGFAIDRFAGEIRDLDAAAAGIQTYILKNFNEVKIIIKPQPATVGGVRRDT